MVASAELAQVNALAAPAVAYAAQRPFAIEAALRRSFFVLIKMCNVKIEKACQAYSSILRLFPESDSSFNEVCSPARIDGRNTAPTPPGFAEIISDDFPVLFHAQRIPGRAALLIVDDHLRRRLVDLKLCAHLLDLRGLLVETRSELRNCRLEVLLLLRHRRL